MAESVPDRIINICCWLKIREAGTREDIRVRLKDYDAFAINLRIPKIKHIGEALFDAAIRPGRNVPLFEPKV